MLNIQSSSQSDPKILFLGYAISDNMFNEVTAKDPYPQIQGTKLIWKIIRGIEESCDTKLDLVSVVPASEYPRNPQVFFGYHKWQHKPPDGEDYIIPFINIIILKHITRLLSAFFFVSRWLIIQKRHSERAILVYAMHSPFIISSLVATHIFGGKVILIVPDLPEFMDLGINRNIIIRAAKRIDAFIMRKLLSRMAGIIALTEHLAGDLSKQCIPSMVMEGSVDKISDNNNGLQLRNYLPSASKEKVIMYTGGLAGLELLLSAFLLIHDPTFRLWICGAGDMANQILNAAAQDRRIVYWGLLPEDDFQKKCLQATIFVSPRSSMTPYIKYSFPSKLLEYMVTGRPVVSTALPGIPSEYHKYIFLLRDETPSALATMLQDVCNKPQAELDEIGRLARDFVNDKKNYLQQGRRMFDFIKSC